MITGPRIYLSFNRQTIFTCYRCICSKLPLSLRRQTIACYEYTISTAHLTLLTIRVATRLFTILWYIGVIRQIFLGVEYKLIADVLITGTIHRNRILRIFRIRHFYCFHLITRQRLPLLFVCLVVCRTKGCKVWNSDSAGLNQRHLVYTVGTPLAICHRLLPGYTYYWVERESWMIKVVIYIRIIVCHVLTPYSLVWTSTVNKIRCYFTKYYL